MRILVTGASGFIGTHLLPALLAHGHTAFAASRSPGGRAGCEWRRAPELGPAADWSGCLRDAEVVVHLAGMARAGSARLDSAAPHLHERVNADGTRALARQAAAAGVKEFIYLSSCHAVATESEKMLTRETVPHPVSVYGRSKLAGEKGVQQELTDTNCRWSILRPPPVYGPGNQGNFARLACLVRSGCPLPLGGIANRRSFVDVRNLTDFIARICPGNPVVHGQVYYPADEDDLSTPQLIRFLARREGRVPRLFALPPKMRSILLGLPGLGPLRKLTTSLFVDRMPLWSELGWRAPHRIAEPESFESR